MIYTSVTDFVYQQTIFNFRYQQTIFPSQSGRVKQLFCFEKTSLRQPSGSLGVKNTDQASLDTKASRPKDLLCSPWTESSPAVTPQPVSMSSGDSS
jgi:hypothetical protein